MANPNSALAAPGLFEEDLNKAKAPPKIRSRMAASCAPAEESWLEASDAYETAKAAS